MAQPPYPLHPSVEAKLHPDYVSFYNEHIIDKQQVHLQSVSASRSSGVLIPGGGPLLSVGKTTDLSIPRKASNGPDVPIRVFTPAGSAPDAGWPLMLYFHGGGWVLGTIDTENPVCTNLCARANCVVVTVDYRLAPEHPYPAAVEDGWEALLWLQSTGAILLNLDLSKCAMGGSSAGGNLTAVLCHKAIQSSAVPRFKLQILSVPVTDNTATVENNASWKENEFTPALCSEKMLWYRRHYIPDPMRWAEPEASPIFYEDGWAEQPQALIIVGEMDVLRDEGIAYGEKLKEAGVRVELKNFEGMPHPFLAMDGVLQQGRDTITFMVEALKEMFHS